MKKKFTLLLAAFMLLMVSAQAQSPLTFQWAHSVDGNTTAGDNVIGMAKSSDGNYYVATSLVRQVVKPMPWVYGLTGWNLMK